MMRHIIFIALVSVLTVFRPDPTHGQPAKGKQIQLEFDASEAEAVLMILDANTGASGVENVAWQRLFTSRPYTRLQKREESFHDRFTEEDFKAFVLSPGLSQRRLDLHKTLEAWRKADLAAAARRVLAYLPSAAIIRAHIYPVIKPQSNSFVFEAATDPAIFLYLNPDIPLARFENKVAHELHHIGLASVAPGPQQAPAGPTAAARTAIEWMGSFGEGFAMLAAAGSPQVHPHAASDQADRTRWDRDMANFNRDLRTLETFFLDIIHGRLKTHDEIEQRGDSFYGVQGPWYTVGYKMAVAIETTEGRAALVRCMADAPRLLVTYNRAATALNRRNKENLALWSPDLLRRIREASE